MSGTRHFFFLIVAVGVVLMLQRPAEAFWGFGSGNDGGTSGLDLVQGYDRNTVITVTGRVAAPVDPELDPVTVVVAVGTERVIVVLGPRWYLQDDSLDWKSGDNVTVRGSKAQGKDGRSYLLAQWVSSPSGAQLLLRNENGRPGWAGGFKGGQQGTAGQQQRGGTGSGRRGR
ncbi:hypothetical protein [Trichlorobacter lovleyi]|uniref:hypothetical protein n=1 Tax=Trichlorobacter lovleyi TaxID=313985 RepID=UPI00247FA22A|nr:hypothetical protein [Trichlorobacter lovleyi]